MSRRGANSNLDSPPKLATRGSLAVEPPLLPNICCPHVMVIALESEGANSDWAHQMSAVRRYFVRLLTSRARLDTLEAVLESTHKPNGGSILELASLA